MGTSGLNDPEEEKRVRLSNLIALTVFSTGTPFAFIFFFYASKVSGVTLIFYILSFWSVIEFNRRRKFKLARLLLVGLLNGAVIHYSIWYGKDSGLHIMLIPFFCVPFLVFSRDDGWIMAAGSFISCLGYVLIDFVHYEPILSMTATSTSIIYHLITGVAWLWLIFEMIYFTNQNYIAVQNLIWQRKNQTASIVSAQEEERRRISRDLHDSMGQLLSTIKVNLERLPDQQSDAVSNSIELIDQSVNEMRNVAFDLMPNTLENYGLFPALEELVERMNALQSFRMEYQVHGISQAQIAKDQQFNIYRIIQEALNNIMKHAEASEVNLQLIKFEEDLTITIEDDGKGFVYDSAATEGSRGLKNIAARTEWMDGAFRVDSGSKIGTTLIISIPLRRLI